MNTGINHLPVRDVVHLQYGTGFGFNLTRTCPIVDGTYTFGQSFKGNPKQHSFWQPSSAQSPRFVLSCQGGHVRGTWVHV